MKKYSLWKLASLFLVVALTFGGCADANLPDFDNIDNGGGGDGGDGGDGGGGAIASFLDAVTPSDARTGLTNLTGFTIVQIDGTNQLAMVDGFNLGPNEGRLLLLDPFNGTEDANGLPVVQVQANQGIPADIGPSLDRPFDIISDGTSLYITTGFDLANDGKIIKVSNFNLANGTVTADFEDLTDDFQLPLNPLFMTLVRGVDTGSGSKDFIYWTQYTNAGSNLVRRVATDGSEEDIVMNNLTFPTGIAHNGSRLVVANTGGGSGGQVLMADLLGSIAAPFNANDFNDVDLVVPATGEAAIVRPFDVVYDGNNGFFYTEGGAITPAPAGAPGPLGQGNGSVRFIADGGTTAQIVSDGLTNAAGIDAIDGDGDGTASVLFSESIATNGRILRRSVDTANVDRSVAPTETDIGLNSPLFVTILSETTPSMISGINYNGGQANSILRFYIGDN